MSGTHSLRNYSDLDSPVHRLPASMKLLAALLVVIGLSLVPSREVGWTVSVLVVVLALCRLSRVPMAVFMGRLALAQPFVLGVALLALFQGRGLTVFVALALKSTVSVATLQLVAHTTRFQDLIDTLRRARLPAAFVLTLALLHRYLFVLVEESIRMRRARAARTWQVEPWSQWRALSSVIAVSFVRSVTRAERISVAMRARGWS